MEMCNKTGPILHIRIGQILTGGYMKYFQEANEATGNKFDIKFTGPGITVSHPTRSITVIDVKSDNDADMRDLMKRLEKLNEEAGK